jgi:hypothetical protein
VPRNDSFREFSRCIFEDKLFLRVGSARHQN